MSETIREYRIAANAIQLLDVRLKDVEITSKEDVQVGDEKANVSIKFKRGVEEVDSDTAYGVLEVHFFEKTDLFSVKFKYLGTIKKLSESIETEKFLSYANKQVVPLLLPYARVKLSQFLLDMKLPNFEIPTIDVINSIRINND